MEIKVYSLSHIGKVRGQNQDNYYCNGVVPDTENSNFRYGGSFDGSKPVLLGVFDGMGGHLHGERASLYAVQACESLFAQYKGGDPFGVMNQICRSSNERICEEMENVVKGRMGSTASMLLFENGNMFICNLGDSPMFLFRGGKMKQVSFEHTERHNYEQIFGNDYDKKKKFRLTQHLGIFPNEMELSPYNSREPAQTGDRFLICSDGVTDMVPEEEIAAIVNGEASLEKAAEQLLKTALDNGGKDNTTLILGEVTGEVQNIPMELPPQSAPAPYGAPQDAPPAPNSAPYNDAPPAAVQKSNKRKLLTVIAIALFAVGLAIVGVLAYLLATQESNSKPAEKSVPTTQAVPPTTQAVPSTTEDNQISIAQNDNEKIKEIEDHAGDTIDKIQSAFEEATEYIPPENGYPGVNPPM